MDTGILSLETLFEAAKGTSDLAIGTVMAAAIVLLIVFRRARRPKQDWVVIDGSNVMYWKGGEPQLVTVQEVISALRKKGATPAVVFDANAGYLVSEKYRHHDYFAQKLGLPEERVMVVPKGSPADTIILQAARDYGARIATNDRFRDWAGDYPEVLNDGLLIRGGYKAKRLWLEF